MFVYAATIPYDFGLSLKLAHEPNKSKLKKGAAAVELRPESVGQRTVFLPSGHVSTRVTQYNIVLRPWLDKAV